MKTRNKIFIAVAVIAAIVLGLGIWLYSSLDGLIASAINTYGPEIVGAKLKVSSVKIAPASGVGSIHDLIIGNPPGFKTDSALKADIISIEIDPATITDDVVVIRRIDIVAPQVTYESASSGSNFDAIQHNVARYVKEKAGDKSGEAAGGKKHKAGKKIIIEHLSIRDAKAAVNSPLLLGKTLTVPLPDIQLKNIGKEKHGIPPAEAGHVITSAITQRVTHAATGAIEGFARKGLETIGKGADKAAAGLKSLFEKK